MKLKNIVIVYDVANDRRRMKIFKLLKNYATRIQYSVFEGNLREEDIVWLESHLSNLINKKEDSIAFFELCERCRKTVRRIGQIPDASGDRDIIV